MKYSEPYLADAIREVVLKYGYAYLDCERESILARCSQCGGWYERDTSLKECPRCGVEIDWQT